MKEFKGILLSRHKSNNMYSFSFYLPIKILNALEMHAFSAVLRKNTWKLMDYITLNSNSFAGGCMDVRVWWDMLYLCSINLPDAKWLVTFREEMLNIRYYALKFSEFSGPHDTSWLNLQKYQVKHFYKSIDVLFLYFWNQLLHNHYIIPHSKFNDKIR